MLKLIGRQPAQRALGLALVAFLQPCVGPCTEWKLLDVQTKVDIKRSPLQENNQGLKWSVSPFKPTDLATGEKLPGEKGDKRFCFKGSGKGQSHFTVMGGIRGRGRFSLGSTISIAGTKGLRHEQSSSWVYATYDGEPSISHQVNLLYSDSLSDGEQTVPGWIARAYIDGVEQGSMEYPGVAELDVRLLQDEDSLAFLARASAYTEESGFLHAGAFDTLFSSSHAPPDDGFEIGFGAFGIDKGGAVYHDRFWFVGPDLGPEPDSEEHFVFGSFSGIGACLADAKAQLSHPSVSLINVEEALEQVSSALSTAISTMFTINNGIKAGEFAEQTEAKSASKIGKQTYQKLHKIQDQLQAMLDKGSVNQGKVKAICKQLEDLIDRSRVGMANMLGVVASSYKQIDRGVDIAPGELPDLFD